jgi:hypothetical protein
VSFFLLHQVGAMVCRNCTFPRDPVEDTRFFGSFLDSSWNANNPCDEGVKGAL